MSHLSSHHSRHHHAMLHAHAPRESHVQCDFGGIVSTFYGIGFGAQGCKTYGLQQGGKDSEISGEAWPCIQFMQHAYMAGVHRDVTHVASNTLLHANAPSTGRVQCLDSRGDFGLIPSPSHIVGVWAKGCNDLQTAARWRRQQRSWWR